MTIGVIQASSQAQKNSLLFNTVKRYAPDSVVVNILLLVVYNINRSYSACYRF